MHLDNKKELDSDMGLEYTKVMGKKHIKYEDARVLILKYDADTTLNTASRAKLIVNVIKHLEPKSKTFWEKEVEKFKEYIWTSIEDDDHLELNHDKLKFFIKKNKSFASKYHQFLIDAHFFLLIIEPIHISDVIYYDIGDYIKNDDSIYHFKLYEVYDFLKSLPFFYLLNSKYTGMNDILKPVREGGKVVYKLKA